MNPEQCEQVRCRICYDLSKPLLSVCGCSGSMAYVHEQCALDWITKKIQNADKVELPKCEVCNQTYSAQMKVGKKKVCPKLLLQKVAHMPNKEIVITIIHTLVMIFAVFQLMHFFGTVLTGNFAKEKQLFQILTTIFTQFISQIYVIFYFSGVLKQRERMIQDSMVQIVQVTLRPKVVIKC